MDQPSYFSSFVDEFKKIASKKNVGQLLSSLAERSGVNPSKLPGIKQVQNIAASGNRSRAAEVAKNIRGYLKSQGSGGAHAVHQAA